MSVDTKKVFNTFLGMDSEYSNAIKQLKQVMKDKEKYSHSYLVEARNQAKQQIMEIKKERFNQAKEVMDQMKEDIKNPKVTKTYKTEQQQLLDEIKRNNNILLFKDELSNANISELKEMHEQYQEDKDFQRLMNIELKKREQSNNLEERGELAQFKAELNQEPEEFKELNKLEANLKFILNNEMYPLDLAEGLENIEYRSIDRELSSIN